MMKHEVEDYSTEMMAALKKRHPSFAELAFTSNTDNLSAVLESPAGDILSFIFESTASLGIQAITSLARKALNNSSLTEKVKKSFFSRKKVVAYSIELSESAEIIQKRTVNLDWDDVFPTEELPSFDVVSTRVELSSGSLTVYQNIEWHDIEQTHIFIYQTCMMSEPLISSILKNSEPPLSIPHSFSILQNSEVIHQVNQADWELSQINREDPYLGLTRKFSCIRCGIVTFGLTSDRVCHECSGGTLSIVGNNKKTIIDAVEKVNQVEITYQNWRELDKEVSSLIHQWRQESNAGESEHALWIKFNDAVSLFTSKKNNYFESRRKEFEANAQAKRDMISRANELAQADDPRDSLQAMRDLMSDWKSKSKHCGRDLDEALWSSFKEIQESFREKLNNYTKSNEEIQKITKRKNEIIAQVILVQHSTAWTECAVRMHELLDQWKTIPKTNHVNDAQLWDRFTEERQVFFSRREAEMARRKTAKLELIKKAQHIQYSLDFSFTTQKMRELMEEWKLIGGVIGEDDELWDKFNIARGVFFDRLKEAQAVSKQKKQAIIEEVRLINKSKVSKSDFYLIFHELMNRWKNSGCAGRADDAQLWSDFLRVKTEIIAANEHQ